jgi:putative toxin-antitoxin system antitoxin component (TIGR02293 family)
VANCRKIKGRLPVIPLLKRLEEALGGERLRNDHDLVRVVEARLPLTALEALRSAGLTDDEIYSLVLPRRTLSHRVSKGERLSRDESDRVVRILRIITFGERLFHEPDRFWRWFRSPMRRIDSRSPLEMLQTEAGARVVEELLIGLDEGFVA